MFNKNKGMFAVTKNEQQSQVKGYNYEFLPIFFPQFKAFEMLHFPKHNVLLKFLALKKKIFFSKRAVHAGTTRNTWQKYVLFGYSVTRPRVTSWLLTRSIEKQPKYASFRMFANRTVQRKISKLPSAVLSNLRPGVFLTFLSLICSLFIGQ